MPSLSLAYIRDILDDLDDDFNLPLIIALSSGLVVLFVVLLFLTVYFSFFNTSGTIFLGSSFNIPGEFDDVERMRNEEEDALPKMMPEDRDNYIVAKQFQEDFPPDAKPLGSTLTEAEQDHITDRGIQAYYFESGLEQGSTSEVIVEDKLDVLFTSNSTNSAILNHPLPVRDNDVVYFEVKLFELSRDALISVGLATKPYPLFRLAGHNRYSIAYESNGTVRVNQPFYSPSIWDHLIEGDVIGCGFRPRSGTIFFTHNGKKIVEAAHNVKFDMYPIVGSRGNSKLSVNLGQLGFVFIEANVKKWGFGPVFGTIGVPPAYAKETGNDKVLDKGEELPPNYPSEEETFFGPPALLSRGGQGNDNNGEASTSSELIQSSTKIVPKPSQIISKPPSYSDEPKMELQHEGDTPTPNEVEERLYERRSSTFDLQSSESNPLTAITATDAAEDGEVINDSNEATGVIAEEAAEDADVEGSAEDSINGSAEATPEPQTELKKVSTSTPKNKNNKKKNNKKKRKGRK